MSRSDRSVGRPLRTDKKQQFQTFNALILGYRPFRLEARGQLDTHPLAPYLAWKLHYNRPIVASARVECDPLDVMSPTIPDSAGPVLDEATFQKLLAAAYMLQEHNDRLRSGTTPSEEKEEPPAVDSDSTAALAQIVDAQHQIHSKDLDLAAAMNLVVDRIRKITGAQGAAIGLLDQGNVTYRACSGSLVPANGTNRRAEASISAQTLLHDVLLRCSDTSNDFRVNPETARALGIRSVIAVPIFHDGKTAGSLELVFSKPNAFQEHDVRTCQLMAGLVTEALTHDAQKEWRKGVAAERASMLEVLEKIKPQLAKLASNTDAVNGDSESGEEAVLSAPPASQDVQSPQVQSPQNDAACKYCGNELAPGEAFCGACGASRSSVPRNDLQSKWATLWNLKKSEPAAEPEPEQASALLTEAAKKITLPVPGSAESVLLPLPEGETAPTTAVGEFQAPPKEEPVLDVQSEPETTALANLSQTSESAPQSDQITPPQSDQKELLESITVPPPPANPVMAFWEKHKSFLKKHPGDLALGAAAVLFLITILWAVTSNNPTTSADSGTPQANAANGAPVKPKKKQAPPAPKLSFFDQVLVSLGLADPPAVPSYSGNPNVPVWIDVHTALYYCPGADLYGKTQQGRIASQHDAQLDQFEPASRKVCD